MKKSTKSVVEAALAAQINLNQQTALRSKHLLALASHEVQSPVSNACGLMELGQIALQKLQAFFYHGSLDYLPTAQQKSFMVPLQAQLQTIQQLMTQAKHENQRGLATLLNLMEWQNLQQHGVKVHFMITALPALLTQAIAVTAELAQTEVEIFSVVDPKLPEWVKIDYDNIFYALKIIIGNARRFSPAKGIIKIRVHALDRQYLQIRVQDFGQGFNEAQLAALFREVPLDEEWHYHKPGLQLSQVKMRLTAGGGYLNIHSQAEQGTTVELRIPYTLTRELPAAANASLNILLIEDDALTQKIIKNLLLEQGHHLTVASNATQALAYAANNAYDLLFLDITLDDRNGVQVMQDILARHPDQPIVVLTAHTASEDQDYFIRKGAMTVLTKPITARHLTQCLADFYAMRDDRLFALN